MKINYNDIVEHISDQLTNCYDWACDDGVFLEDAFVTHIKSSYPQIKLTIIKNIFTKYEEIDVITRTKFDFDCVNFVKVLLSESEITFSAEFIGFLSGLGYVSNDDIKKLLCGATQLDIILEPDDFSMVVKSDF
jgi:hypothetical protein